MNMKKKYFKPDVGLIDVSPYGIMNIGGGSDNEEAGAKKRLLKQLQEEAEWDDEDEEEKPYNPYDALTL